MPRCQVLFIDYFVLIIRHSLRVCVYNPVMTAREGTLELELAGEAVMLDPRRALVWPAQRAVIIADPHIGKDDTFRRAGIPVPAGIAEADFDRLTQLLTDHGAERLVVLGDLLHARLDSADDCVRRMARWREGFADLEVLIVRGNHDAHAGPPPGALGFVSVDEPHIDGPFAYRHYPLADGGAQCPRPFVLAGHLHPGVTVALGGQSARRVHCFWKTGGQMVLPAFGAFTGTARIDSTAPGQAYAVGRDRVIALPRPAMV